MKRWRLLDDPDISVQRKALFAGARVLALFLALLSAVGVVGLATRKNPDMDQGLRWGMCGLMIVILGLSVWRVFAPTSQNQRSGRVWDLTDPRLGFR
jgi:hypothetical protein